jgi:serine/threonine-protein kinase RsbT
MVLSHGLDRAVTIRSESDIVTVRKVARCAAEALGFGITDVTRIVTAASELARNVFLYAGSGVMQWRELDAGGAAGIELKLEDNGPGIANIEQAMEAGYSTSGGLGLGLPGAKRLMDEMEISSQVGKGTIVTIKKWLKR